MTVVLDTSALLAVSFGEPGSDRVLSVLDTARMSAVSLAETIGKLLDRGIPHETALASVAGSGVVIVDFDAAQAEQAGLLRSVTRARGLSLGDRCCLALAKSLGAPVLTADRAWVGLDVGVRIDLIR